MKTVSIPDHTHDQLELIRKVRSKDSWQKATNRQIVADLVDKAHKKECKK